MEDMSARGHLSKARGWNGFIWTRMSSSKLLSLKGNKTHLTNLEPSVSVQRKGRLTYGPIQILLTLQWFYLVDVDQFCALKVPKFVDARTGGVKLTKTLHLKNKEP